MIFNFLSHLDLFRKPVVFYFLGSYKRSSYLGQLFSFLIFAFLLYQFIISDFFAKTNPTVIVQTQTNSFSKQIDFNRDNQIVIALLDQNTFEREVDLSYMSISVEYITNNVSTAKAVEKCEFEYLPRSLSLDDYKRYQINSLFCLKDTTFHIDGAIDELSFSYLQVMLYPCKNSSLNNWNCKSNEEIKEFFKRKDFSIVFNNFNFDFHNFTYPFKPSQNYIMNFLDSALIKSNFIYLKTAEVNTNDGLFFKNSRLQTSIVLDKNRQDYELRKSDSDPFAKWYFLASKEEIKATREYQKLPEIVADLAGMVQLEILLCFFFTNIITYISSFRIMVHKLYDFGQNTPQIQLSLLRIIFQWKNVMKPTS